VRYRRLGRTGLEVSEIGFGAWGIGGDAWQGATDERSLEALRRAVELGINFVDTAIAYGDGHSEELVGRIKREHPDLIVATKINPANWQWPAIHGQPADDYFPAEHVVARTEQSLRNLGLETIDLQQFHVWSDDWVDQGTWREGIERLKRDGKIRFFGVSLNDAEGNSAVRLVESGLVDSVQVVYNIFDQAAEQLLFPACEHRNVGVIVRVPLDEGGLTGQVRPETEFEPGDFRADYFKGERKAEVWRRVQAIAADLQVPIERLPELAIRFCLTPAAVSTVIVGMRSPERVEANAAFSDGVTLTHEQLETLRKHMWVRDWYRQE
jgi:aryl-alcohol dehydrogenase-like predicted oxidoreductase